MKRYAILLGCEEYKERNVYPETSFCHRDVELLKDALVNYCDFAEQDIYYELLTVFDERTPKDILDKIKELVNGSKAGDTVLFYYAGHGDYIAGDSYLVLPNTKRENIKQTAIPLRDISDILRHNQRVNVRIFDCCHSGQDVRSAVDFEIDAAGFTRDIIHNSHEGWVTFAACAESEKSHPDTKLEQGIFTYSLVQAIKEYEEGTEILPELLKVSVCKKVLNWCEENSKIQNPTFNTSISGNISLGIRKRKNEEDEAYLTDKNEVSNKNSQLIDRISTIRGSKKSNDEKSKELFKQYIIKIHESFKDNKNIIKTYDLSLIETHPSMAEEIPDDIKPEIVRFFNSKKLDTLHKYKIEKEYEKDRRPQFTRDMFPSFKPKLISIDYIIEQEWHFPESYTSLTLDTDGYLPEAKVFVYISPLQLTACVVSGISIKGKTELFKSIFIDISKEIDNKFINEFVINLISKFNSEYEKSVERTIKYYEHEMALVDGK